MAAPSVTGVGSPAGKFLPDGYSSKIAFSRLPTASFWEKTVQPPGADGGDAIDTTTMRNATVRTHAPRSLMDFTEAPVVVAYDPNCYNQIMSTLINEEGSITVHFPDGSTLAFWAYLRTFEPNALTEGEFPEATINLQPTNWDPANDVEAAPVLTSVAGT